MDSEVLVFVPLEACLIAYEESLWANERTEITECFVLCCWYVDGGCAKNVFVYVLNGCVYVCMVLIF